MTLKGQGQIWPQFKVGQGHVVTQVGHIIYQSMRLYETNALESQSHVSISFWSQVIGKKMLVTSSDLRWPLEGSATKNFTWSINKCFTW